METDAQASPRIVVEYRVSEEYRAQQLRETGQLAPETATVGGTLADLSPALRSALVDAEGVQDTYQFLVAGLGDREAKAKLTLPTGEESLAAAVAAALEATDLLARRREAKEAAEGYARAVRTQALAILERGAEEIESMAVWQAATAEYIIDVMLPDPEMRAALRGVPDWDNPVHRAVAAAEKAREKAEAEAFRVAMEAWATQHGSPRLQQAINRGYKATRTYAEERAALEAPGWIVDVSDRAEWRDRVDPSAHALAAEEEATALAKGLAALGSLASNQAHARVVWLTQLPMRSDWDVPQQEALVVRGYLGRYDLILPLGAPDEDAVEDGE